MIMACQDCGSTRVTEWKRVMLGGQPWLVSNDGYRFWVKPADGNPLIDRDPIHMMEYKHNDGPTHELAALFFSLLPDQPSRE